MENNLKTFIYGIIGGVCIAIGGAAFLSIDNKVLGACFFVVGLFTICTFGFNLYTGKVCYLFENDGVYALRVLLIWVGNLVGCWLTGTLLRFTRIITLSDKAQGMVETKLGDSLISVFILAIFCNILIFVAVDGFKNNPHEFGKYMSLFFGVTVFIICGFEHCVANMFYISMAGMWSAKAFLFIIVNSIGNAVGGWVLPLAKKLGEIKTGTK